MRKDPVATPEPNDAMDGCGKKTSPRPQSTTAPAAVEAADAETISHCIRSTTEVFATILDETIHTRAPEEKTRNRGRRPLTSLIGVGGDACGLIALSMSDEVALNVAHAMDGKDRSGVGDSVKVALADLVSHIASNARSRITRENPWALELSLPTVAQGDADDWDTPSVPERAEIEFESELGPFYLQIAFRIGPDS